MLFKKLPLTSLTAVSTSDGRYEEMTAELRGYASEFGLIYYRFCHEINYLLGLNDHNVKYGGIKMPIFTETQVNFLTALKQPDDFLNTGVAEMVKTAEKTSEHDVKAVENVLRKILSDENFSPEILSHIHFGLTSEDVNSVAQANIIAGIINDIYTPLLDETYNNFLTLANANARVPMLAYTHGQPATPTTFGKEMQIFAKRIHDQTNRLDNFKIKVKLAGASGNYNAHYAAYPEIDWPQFTENFIKKYYNNGNNRDGRYVVNHWVPQIEPHDTFCELFGIMTIANNILLKFSKDMWQYISMRYVTQKPKAGEVGSSAMPHKINPIKFENAEGNLIIANGMFQTFIGHVSDSRLQRHLSDSTIIRNFGSAFAHCIIAMINIEKGLEKISINKTKMMEDLTSNVAVISEAYQQILRREGIPDAYKKLEKEVKGNEGITIKSMHAFVDTLDIPDTVKDELKLITPANYLGLAEKLALGFPVADPDIELRERARGTVK